MNAFPDQIRFQGPKAPGADMRPRLLGCSLGIPIIAGIGDDNDYVAVPCVSCSSAAEIVIHVHRHRRIDGPTFHTKAGCSDGRLAGRSIFVRVVKIVPGDWVTAPRLF